MEVGNTSSNCLRSLQSPQYKDLRVDVGARLLQSFLKPAHSTTQRYKNFRVDVGVTNFCSVPTVYEVYNTKINTSEGGQWRYKEAKMLR